MSGEKDVVTELRAIGVKICDEAADEIERLRSELAKCGRENCFGHDAGEHVARWVREERLLEANARAAEMQERCAKVAELGSWGCSSYVPEDRAIDKTCKAIASAIRSMKVDG